MTSYRLRIDRRGKLQGQGVDHPQHSLAMPQRPGRPDPADVRRGDAYQRRLPARHSGRLQRPLIPGQRALRDRRQVVRERRAHLAVRPGPRLGGLARHGRQQHVVRDRARRRRRPGPPADRRPAHRQRPDPGGAVGAEGRLGVPAGGDQHHQRQGLRDPLDGRRGLGRAHLPGQLTRLAGPPGPCSAPRSSAAPRSCAPTASTPPPTGRSR
jgi:hypothetical protein